MNNDFNAQYGYYPQYAHPGYAHGDGSGMMPAMIQPTMIQAPIYQHGPYPMAYYGPPTLNQSMIPQPQMMQMPPHGYVAPMPQDGGMSAHYGYQPQMMPASSMGSGQPMYPMFYPPHNQGSNPGQYHNQY